MGADGLSYGVSRGWRFETTKRLMDLSLAALGLAATAPLQFLLALVILKKLGKPVIFSQNRPGRDGELFQLRKFRTMLDVDESRNLVSDEQRLTSFGKFLRSTSLDELPTLFNVLRGEMSMVGPRPLLPEYLNLYSSEQQLRHAVRPGVTGLAQVNGRNSLSWDEKFDLDVQYVRTRSLMLDLRILATTLTAVLKRKDISASDSVTMHRFTGPMTGTEERS